LMKLQNVRNSATPGPSNSGPQSVSTAQVSEDGSSSATQTQPYSSTAQGVPTSLTRPRPKPRPTGKGKAKEVSSTSEYQITSNESTMNESTAMNESTSMSKPRPITRAKGKSATVERTSTSLENVLESGDPTSDNTQHTPRRGSKRGNITQLDEAPVPKKRKTRTPKRASIPASEPLDPAIASASMSLQQLADSTSVAIDADETIQDEHDPAPTTKRILRKRKTATPAATIEDAGGVPVKRLRSKARK